MKKLLIILFFLISFPVRAYQAAVVSAEPAASKVGVEILKKGGNAADAAVATAMALGVVEPYNSGLGGGGFLLYYDAAKKEFSFLDYRETAPSQATLTGDLRRYTQGIDSVAIPGFVKGMEVIQQKLCKLSWPDLLDPAIRLAKKGISLDGMMAEKIQEHQSLLEKDPYLLENYLKPYRSGVRSIDQSPLANTLTLLRDKGGKEFYSGELARKISDFSRKNGGLIRGEDLSSYRALWRKPYQFTQGSYDVTSSPIPSSGGMALSLLFRKAVISKLSAERPYSSQAFRNLIENLKDYFEYREAALGDSNTDVVSHTTHLCVIDSEGNIAAMTNTLNNPFGSGVSVAGTGILLNDEMNDFSLVAGSPNQLRPGRRPLSSMAPTIIFKQGKPYLAIGTPGGLTIPQNIFQILFYTWAWQSTLDQAIAQPKIYFSPKNPSHVLVENKISNKVIKELGITETVEVRPTIGNVQALWIKDKKITIPLSDPRFEGKGYKL